MIQLVPFISYSVYTQKLANFMKVWGVASEDVGSREDFCSCKICIHAILGARDAAKPPWMGSRRSSIDTSHAFYSLTVFQSKGSK